MWSHEDFAAVAREPLALEAAAAFARLWERPLGDRELHAARDRVGGILAELLGIRHDVDPDHPFIRRDLVDELVRDMDPQRLAEALAADELAIQLEAELAMADPTPLEEWEALQYELAAEARAEAWAAF